MQLSMRVVMCIAKQKNSFTIVIHVNKHAFYCGYNISLAHSQGGDRAEYYREKTFSTKGKQKFTKNIIVIPIFSIPPRCVLFILY